VRLDLATGSAHHLATMRPPCQDGVIAATGHLYWGPWMCGCALSLYGNICLAPAGQAETAAEADDPQLESGDGDPRRVEKLKIEPGD
jgi:hypothetical protein